MPIFTSNKKSRRGYEGSIWRRTGLRLKETGRQHYVITAFIALAGVVLLVILSYYVVGAFVSWVWNHLPWLNEHPIDPLTGFAVFMAFFIVGGAIGLRKKSSSK